MEQLLITEDVVQSLLQMCVYGDVCLLILDGPTYPSPNSSWSSVITDQLMDTLLEIYMAIVTAFVSANMWTSSFSPSLVVDEQCCNLTWGGVTQFNSHHNCHRESNSLMWLPAQDFCTCTSMGKLVGSQGGGGAQSSLDLCSMIGYGHCPSSLTTHLLPSQSRSWHPMHVCVCTTLVMAHARHRLRHYTLPLHESIHMGFTTTKITSLSSFHFTLVIANDTLHLFSWKFYKHFHLAIVDV